MTTTHHHEGYVEGEHQHETEEVEKLHKLKPPDKQNKTYVARQKQDSSSDESGAEDQSKSGSSPKTSPPKNKDKSKKKKKTPR